MDETTVRQLIKDMGTDCSELTQIRSKDGVSVYRVKSGNGRYVLKAFDNAQYCREIGNYLILHGLRVPTIGVIAYTDNALLLEDLEFSDEYRLAAQEDMADETGSPPPSPNGTGGSMTAAGHMWPIMAATCIWSAVA